MADLKLYGFVFSTFVRTARLGLHEKGIDYESMPLEMGSEEHLRLNPFGKIPVLTHGDTVIYESLAIAAYLDTHFGGPRLLPDGPDSVRTMRRIGAYNDSVQKALTMGVIFERMAKPMFGMETDEQTVAASLPKVERMLPVIDAALAEAPWFRGAEPNQADWYFVPCMAYATQCRGVQEMIAAQPHLTDWFARVSARESFAATVPQAD